jgi:rhodanese-related sulfurtransferase
MMESVTANELSNMVASGKHVDLIDVRTPMEFRAMHATFARNEPLSGLKTAGAVDPQ